MRPQCKAGLETDPDDVDKKNYHSRLCANQLRRLRTVPINRCCSNNPPVVMIIGRIDILRVRTTRTGAPTKAASMTGVRCAQLTSGTIRLGDQHRPREHSRHACVPGEVVNAGKQRLEGSLIKHPGADPSQSRRRDRLLGVGGAAESPAPGRKIDVIITSRRTAPARAREPTPSVGAVIQTGIMKASSAIARSQTQNRRAEWRRYG
jgi:hypothetical protein